MVWNRARVGQARSARPKSGRLEENGSDTGTALVGIRYSPQRQLSGVALHAGSARTRRHAGRLRRSLWDESHPHWGKNQDTCEHCTVFRKQVFSVQMFRPVFRSEHSLNIPGENIITSSNRGRRLRRHPPV